MQILHLYLSPDHNYFGHHGKPAGEAPIIEVDEVECVADQGLVNDRFFGYKDNYKGQITFFEHEVYERLCQQFEAPDLSPSVFRRNVITRGVDLNSLIGTQFEIQGIRFEATEECRPCYWMDQAVGTGAELAMKGHGGLRARILTSGVLRKHSAQQ